MNTRCMIAKARLQAERWPTGTGTSVVPLNTEDFAIGIIDPVAKDGRIIQMIGGFIADSADFDAALDAALVALRQDVAAWRPA